MIDLWWEEARAQRRAAARQPAAGRDPQPAAATARGRATLRLPPARRAGARSRRRSTSATARTRSPPTSSVPDGVVAEGVLLAMGSVLGGFAFYLLDGRLRYVHNLYGKDRDTCVGSDAVIGPGRTQLAFAFTKTTGFAGPRRARGRRRSRSATATIPHFTPMRFSTPAAG